ncbi:MULTISPECIES: TetR/AcrR family transcriptional regulator [unclassified Bradyrhizobium]|uniref:TetR/AcrR family transcriptional regulator n=1 Tax=unclassified Bradyrhizobium TaxID=2631580 RepID=UPI001FFA4325|nr:MULTISPECIES: TetR/AcrR family transcriptional regulator [unclassified Bradyrhizobium]
MKEQAPVRLRDRNRLRTRQELLDTALDLFEAGGLATCSVDAVAKKAGASKTTAYTYFPGGIDEMLRDQYHIISDRVRVRGEQMRNTAITAEDRIIALMAALLDVCAEPKVGRFYMMLTPALSPLLEPVVGETSGRFRKMIADDLHGKLPHGVSPLVCATLIVGAGREAAIAVAREPGQREGLLTALRMMVRAMLSAKAGR